MAARRLKLLNRRDLATGRRKQWAVKRALSWAMCDVERVWTERRECIRKQRWQLTTAGRSGPARRSANPEMILSLKDDVDDQVLEDAMFKEAEPFEVTEVLSVLQRLASSCEESDSRFA